MLKFVKSLFDVCLLHHIQQEKQVAEALSAAETWQNHHAQELKDKNQLELELSLLNR